MNILKVGLRFFFLSLKKNLSYRTNFYLTLIDSLVWFLLTVTFYESIYGNFDSLIGLNKQEVYLVVGTSELIKSILFTFFIENLPYIPKLMNTGQLDQFVILPVNSQFIVSFQHIDFGNLANVMPAIFLLTISLIKLNVAFSMMGVALYIAYLILSIVLGYSLWFIIMTLSIWFVKLDGIHELFLSLLNITQYPKKVFINSFVPKIFFVLLPLIMMSNIPVEVLIGKNQFIESVIFIFLTGLMFSFSIIFWRFSLKYYFSASS